MKRVTLDTNELVSAFNFGGQSLEIVRDAAAKKVEIAISEPIVNETLRVLREKFDWQPYRLHALGDRLKTTFHLVEPKETLSVLADEPDNRILEAAKESGSQFIVTEDLAMLRLKRFEGIPIMNVRDFLARGESLER
jgi:putative PIN family toxin of toxin-antitoxin system